MIHAGQSFVEHYCNRQFLQATHTEVVTTGQDGSIILPHPPIDYIIRACVASGSWLTIQNTSGGVAYANYATSEEALILTHTASGVATTTILTYADEPTLYDLATAITGIGSGWTASVTSGFGSYPSADLVSQYGSCKAASTLTSWQDDGRSLGFNRKTGIIEGDGGIGWLTPQNTVWSQGASYYGPSSYQQLRITYVGGYTTVPEDLVETTANLVIQAMAGAEGKAQSVSLGQYSYTLFSDSMLTKSDRRVLAYYRDRRW